MNDIFKDIGDAFKSVSHDKIENKPKYETPEQWEKRTGKKLLPENSVLVRFKRGSFPHNWYDGFYGAQIKQKRILNDAHDIIVNVPGQPMPPDNWEPIS